MGLIDYNQLPNLDLFGIFTFHLVFSTWGIFGHWSPDAYLYYNAIFLLVLVWCIKESKEESSTNREIPLSLAIRINVLSIIFDCLIIFACFPLRFWEDLFSVIGGLLNLLLRIITVSLLSKLCSDQTGGLNDGLPSILSPIFGVNYDNTNNEPYQNIDSAAHPHQSYPKAEPVISPSTGSYSFTSSNLPAYQA